MISKQRKKRNYSRNGCIQCKQRKFKCDEHKPQCYACLNQNRECSYRQLLKFKDTRSFTINGTKLSNIITNDSFIKSNNLSIDNNSNFKENIMMNEKSINNKIKNTKEISKSNNIPATTISSTSSSSTASSKRISIPITKPSSDPFFNQLPQVVQNQLYSDSLNQVDKNKKKKSKNKNNNNNKNKDQQSNRININTQLQQSQSQSQSQSPFPSTIDNVLSSNNPLLMMPFNQSNDISQLDLENSLFNGASNLITDLNSLINSFEIDFNNLDFQNLHQFQLNNNNSNNNNNNNNNTINNPFSSEKQKINLNFNPSNPFTPSLSNLRFEGISPTNFSVPSTDSTPISNKETSIDQDIQQQQQHNSQIQLLNNEPIRKNGNLSNDKIVVEKGEVEQEEEQEEEQEQEQEDDDDYEEDEEQEGEDNYYYTDYDTSNNNYIKTLTKSLANYATPKMHTIPMPTDLPIKDDQNFISDYQQISSSNPKFKTFDKKNSHLKAFPPPTKDILNPFDYIEMLNKTMKNDDIDSLTKFFNWSEDSSHSKYLKIFVTHIHLNSIPFSTNYTHNAYIKTFLKQAKYSPHLLFAILSISARFEVYQIEQNPNISDYDEKLNYHKSFRTYYLSSCLKSLESILHSKQTTLNNIESLLLTIQVLASDFSGNKGSQWRTHLHGAKDLLIKYCRYRPLSLELTVVWLWFYSMEVLAALTAPHGGTIHDFDEMDEFLPVLCPKIPQYLINLGRSNKIFKNPEDKLLEPGKLTYALIYMGIAIEGKLESNDKISRFNMYLGYDETVLEIFNALVYAIECIRCKNDKLKTTPTFKIYESKILNSQGKSLNSDFLLSLFGLIEKARTFKYINNKPPYIVPLGNDVHPSEILNKICLTSNLKNEKEEQENSNILENVLISAYIHPNQAPNKVNLINTPDDGKNSPDPKIKKYTNNISLLLSSTSSKSTISLSPSPSNEIESISSSNESKSYSSNLYDILNPINTSIDRTPDVYFSWIDLAQQLNTDAAFLRLLTLHGGISTYGMSIKSSLIQDIVSRMVMGLYGLVRYREDIAEIIDNNIDDKMNALNDRYKEGSIINEDTEKVYDLREVKELANWEPFQFDIYLNYQFDNRLVMVQWPLYVCGLCCVEPKHKAIIECCFSGLIGLGVGSGELSLKKLKKIWTLQKLGKFDYDKFNLFGQGFDDDEEDDYVPFM